MNICNKYSKPPTLSVIFKIAGCFGTLRRLNPATTLHNFTATLPQMEVRRMLRDKSLLENFNLVETLTDEKGEKISGGGLTWGGYAHKADSNTGALEIAKRAMSNTGFKVVKAVDRTIWGEYSTGDDILVFVDCGKSIFFINEGNEIKDAVTQHALVVKEARRLGLIG